MPGSIPELNEIGPQVTGEGEHSLKDEVRRLLNRRTIAFPGTLICMYLIQARNR
jgi:hypothetical protein